MRMLVECDRCAHRFIMRSPVNEGFLRVSCPQCRETMVLLLQACSALAN